MTTKTGEAKNPHAGFLQINVDIRTAQTGRTGRWLVPWLASLASLTFLAACTGSGSIINNPSAGGFGVDPATVGDNAGRGTMDDENVDLVAARQTIATGAQASPVPGSVAQSSIVSETSPGTTAMSAVPDVTVTFTSDPESGELQPASYDLTVDGQSILATGGTDLTLSDGIPDTSIAMQGIRAIRLTDPARLSQALILTDFSGSVGSAEYISWGYYRFENPAATDSYSYTVFADGNTGYDGNNLNALIGTATYTGKAVGVYADAVRRGDFWADVELTAEFGTGTDIGTIGGMVSNIRHGDNVPYSVTGITLSEETIGSMNNGFVTGDTSVTDNAALTGKWGAQFFGSGPGYPGSVAGTFGVSDTGLSLLGAFKADPAVTPFMTTLTSTAVGGNLGMIWGALKAAAEGSVRTGSAAAVGGLTASRGSTQSSIVGGDDISAGTEYTGVSVAFTTDQMPEKADTVVRVGGNTFLSTATDGTPDHRLPDDSLADHIERIENTDENSEALVLTDIVGSTLDDYISWGYWREEAPDNPADLGGPVYSYAAFVASNWNYDEANLAALIGTATYTGRAFGIYADAVRRDEFWGDVTMTADFGPSDDRGTLGGMVTNIRHGADNVEHFVPDIILAEQGIGSMNNGFVRGTTSVTGYTTLEGKWGAQFFGSGSGYPGSVGGTFAVSNAAGTLSLLGSFKADTTDTQPHPLDFFVPTAGSTALSTFRGIADANVASTIPDIITGKVATASNFGREPDVVCKFQNPPGCSVDIDIERIILDNAGIVDLSLAGTDSGRTLVSSMISETVAMGGVTFARARSAINSTSVSTPDYDLETFAGWLTESAFGAVRITSRPSGGEAWHFVPYSVGDPVGSNPAAGVAAWSGGAVASVKADRTFLMGDATITLDLEAASPTVDVMLDAWRGIDGTAMPSVGAVSYTGLALAGGTFMGTAPQQIQGRFYGTTHSEVGGIFNTATLNGAFGGTRNTTGPTTSPFMPILSQTIVGGNLGAIQGLIRTAARGLPRSETVTVTIGQTAGTVAAQSVTQSSHATEEPPGSGPVTTPADQMTGVGIRLSGLMSQFRAYTAAVSPSGENTLLTSASHNIDPHLIPDTSLADELIRLGQGNAQVVFLTDYTVTSGIDPAPDTIEYVSWGYRRFERLAGEIGTYNYHAFASGNTGYPQSNLQALTGTATYNGKAFGIYANALRRDEFWADVTLTAAFGASDARGTVSGMISNFRHGMNNVEYPVASIMLGMGTIGSSKSGFFTGDTSVTDDSTLTGKWGAQFYGSGSANPGSIAGTFGVSNTDGSTSLLGAFKADPAHPLTVFAAAAGSTSLAALQSRAGATGVNLVFGGSAEAGAGNFGSEMATTCFSNTCGVPVNSSSNVTFGLSNVSNLSLTTSGITISTSMITQGFAAHGVTLARGRSSGTRFTNSVALETFGGWAAASAFGAVQIAQGAVGSEIHRFTSYTVGVPSGSNPAAGFATWSGGAVASVKADRTFLRGDATITLDLSDSANPTVDVMLDTWLGIDGTAMSSVAAVSYANLALAGGAFSGTSPQQIEGRFYGTTHSEVGGIFNTATLNGAFGGTRATMGPMTAPHTLTVFAPAAGSTSLAALQSRGNVQTTDLLMGGSAATDNFGSEPATGCADGECFPTYATGLGGEMYGFNMTSLSMARTLTGFTADTTDGFAAHGVTLARGRSSGTHVTGSVPLEFETFAGWLTGSFFGSIQVKAGAPGSETYRFLPFTDGTPSGSNPAAGVATWSGGAVASVKADRTFLRGDATITLDLTDSANPTVDVMLDGWLNDVGTAMPSVEAVSYAGLALAGGAFSGIAPQQIDGRFYGTTHSEVGGIFNTATLNGAFGGTRAAMGPMTAPPAPAAPLPFGEPATVNVGSNTIIATLRGIAASGTILNAGPLATASNYASEGAVTCGGFGCTYMIGIRELTHVANVTLDNLALALPGMTLDSLIKTTNTVTNTARAHGVTLAQGSTEATLGGQTALPFAFETFAGWNTHSAFGSVQVRSGTSGSYAYHFIPYYFGVPSTTLPTSGIATWSGGAVATVKSDRAFIRGDAALTVTFGAFPTLEAAFTGWRNINGAIPSGANVGDVTFDEVFLTISGSAPNIIAGFDSYTSQQGMGIAGRFYGTDHAEVAGHFNTEHLIGAFGATRPVPLTFTSANADNHGTITDLRGRISGSTALRTGSVVTPTTMVVGPGTSGSVTVAGQALTFRANSAVTNLSLIQTRVGTTGNPDILRISDNTVTNIEQAHGVNLAMGRTAGTIGDTGSNQAMEFNSFGGWNTHSAFGSVRIRTGTSGSYQYTYLPYYFGEPTGSLPTSGVATWSGGAVASVRSASDQSFVRGDATITYNFDTTATVDAVFDGWLNINGTDPGLAAVTFTGAEVISSAGAFRQGSELTGLFYGDRSCRDRRFFQHQYSQRRLRGNPRYAVVQTVNPSISPVGSAGGRTDRDGRILQAHQH
ncbi:MAG: hypothetical protein V6Z81_10615 [Parvularculales bacterium]